ncbi:MAG: oligoendopeptidase F, partial [Clostridia bacterium]|nr:oligoendopeptidase F [Clostridia bacterium]
MKKLPKRNEIEEKYKWKLEDIYADDSAFETDYAKTGDLVRKMEGMQDGIADSKSLLKCLELYEDMFCLVDNLFSYSRMRMDEDNANSKYQVMFGRARELAVKAGASAAFIEPLVLALPEEVVTGPELAKYK